MEMNELLERIEKARVLALADRDRLAADSKDQDPMEALASTIQARSSDAVAAALGRILGLQD